MFIQFFVVLVALNCASGSLLATPAYHHTGSSSQYRNQDSLGNYAFGYDENHATGGTFRREKSDAWGNKVGSYGLRDADGRVRVVNYIADGYGFRAAISSNEPGVAAQAPAATSINKPAAIVHPIPEVLEPIDAAPTSYLPTTIGVVGPAAYAPAALTSVPIGLLAAPTTSYHHPSYVHPYPIRR